MGSHTKQPPQAKMPLFRLAAQTAQDRQIPQTGRCDGEQGAHHGPATGDHHQGSAGQSPVNHRVPRQADDASRPSRKRLAGDAQEGPGCPFVPKHKALDAVVALGRTDGLAFAVAAARKTAKRTCPSRSIPDRAGRAPYAKRQSGRLRMTLNNALPKAALRQARGRSDHSDTGGGYPPDPYGKR